MGTAHVETEVPSAEKQVIKGSFFQSLETVRIYLCMLCLLPGILPDSFVQFHFSQFLFNNKTGVCPDSE